MKRIRLLGVVGGLSSLLLLSACSVNCVNTHFAPYQSSSPKKLKDFSGTTVEVSNVGGMEVNGIMHGRVKLANKTDDDQSVKYHFVWSSPDGGPEGENTPWIPLVITQGTSTVVESVAPTGNATRFDVQVCTNN